MPDQRLAIAQVSPFAWESKTEIGDYVRLLSQELHGRGHRLLIIAPSNSAELVHQSRKLLRGASSNADSLLARAGDAPDFSSLDARIKETQDDVRRVFQAVVEGQT